MADSVLELKTKVAQSCRILAMTGLVREITGHVSARIPGTDEMVVRCRYRHDPGVAMTSVSDIKRVCIDGQSDELGDDYKVPGEFSIHSELYRHRSDVQAVIHGHPRSSLLCGIMGLPLRPIIGAYDPAAMRLATGEGIPTYPRAVLISTPKLGREVAATMERSDTCLLRGHGFVVTGRNVEDATVRSIKLETLADVTLQTAMAGRLADSLPDEDIDEITDFMDNRGGWNMTHIMWTWDFFLRQLGEAARV